MISKLVVPDCYSRSAAAEKAGMSLTHFNRLANETPPVIPHPINGSVVAFFTLDQILEIAGRLKRNPESRLALVRELSEGLSK